MALLFISVFLIQCYVCGLAIAQTPLAIDRQLLDAMKQVESGGNPCAIGDNGRSIGAYQIMKAYYDDASQFNPHLRDCCRTYKNVWGKDSEAYSEEVIRSYMGRYATQQRLGRPPTNEDIARIHNGGPNGYKRTATDSYWEKVMSQLRNGRQTRTDNDHCSPACAAGQCCSSKGTCMCLSSTFVVQPCTENRTGQRCSAPCSENCMEQRCSAARQSQAHVGITAVLLSALLCLMDQ